MQYLSTIVVAAIVAAVFIAIVVNEVKKRKKGQGCSCGCGNCGMSEICHSKQKSE